MMICPGGDDSKIASGSNDHTVRLWHCISGECEMILAGDKPVWSVAFSYFPPPPPSSSSYVDAVALAIENTAPRFCNSISEIRKQSSRAT